MESLNKITKKYYTQGNAPRQHGITTSETKKMKKEPNNKIKQKF
jgi:hypothetical protein